MPKLRKSWKDIEETSGGGFADIEPGAYVLKVTACQADEFEKEMKRAGGDFNEVPDKAKYFTITWDVAEGPSKDAYANSQYPPTMRVYFTEKSERFLKFRLHMFARWNDGFQPTVAFDNDQWGLFVGKRFGAVVRRRLYTAGPNSKTPGADRTSMEIAAWLHPEAYESGDFSERLLADRDQRDKGASQQPQTPITPPAQTMGITDIYDEDVPF